MSIIVFVLLVFGMFLFFEINNYPRLSKFTRAVGQTSTQISRSTYRTGTKQQKIQKQHRANKIKNYIIRHTNIFCFCDFVFFWCRKKMFFGNSAFCDFVISLRLQKKQNFRVPTKIQNHDLNKIIFVYICVIFDCFFLTLRLIQVYGLAFPENL